MNILENKLWQNENTRRKKLWHIALTLVTFSFVIVTALLLWVIQPLIFSAKSVQLTLNSEPERLKSDVRMLSEILAPHGESLADNLNKKAEYIKSEFEKTGAKIFEEKFIVDGSEYRNIGVSFGKDSIERIVIGAHYDTAGEHAGADDNSSGVAWLMELARLLTHSNLSIHVELVAFALEEPPYFGTTKMGSFVHAKFLHDTGVKIRLMLCLEMIGYFTDEPNSQDYPISVFGIFYPSKGNFVAVVGNFRNGLTTRNIKNEMQKAVDIPIYSINAPTFVEGIDFSDHRNFWHFGFNAVMITDTAFYRNKNYHTPADTWEKLDYFRMAKVVDATYTVIITDNQ
ncbi:MAG: M28 family peptidase [Pyrinomonadaceae bacterium]